MATSILPYKCEYAKSGRSSCRQCGCKIAKDELRMATMEPTTYFDGMVPHWYHSHCFFRRKRKIESEALIHGFFNLRAEDQEYIKSELTLKVKKRSTDSLYDENQPSGSGSSTSNQLRHKNARIEVEVQDKSQTFDELIRTQSAEFFKIHDNLKMYTKKKDWINILYENQQYVPKGENKVLLHVTDIIYFGAMLPCSKCGDGQLIFQNTGYVCVGHLSEWGRCENFIKEPPRRMCTIPNELQMITAILKHTFQVRTRLIKDAPKRLLKVANKLMEKKREDLDVYESYEDRMVTVNLKNGTDEVDPNSGLKTISHIYCENKRKYVAVLNLVDVRRDTNSYYKLQLLESNDLNNKKYWIFRSWGRISTGIGGQKIEPCNDLDAAKKLFCQLYQEKTGNSFDAEVYQKIRGKFFKIDLDYGEEVNVDAMLKKQMESKLPISVQNLMEMIFSIDSMKNTMSEFNLDLQKMPLGKISNKQITDAMTVLSRICNLIEEEADPAFFIEASNHYYSLIPHNFGVHKPPMIDKIDQVIAFGEQLESLLEIVNAYDMLQRECDNNKNFIDVRYGQLRTIITPMNRSDAEFKMLQEYVKNTHASTHKEYELEIDEAFKISRSDEEKRYEKFKNFKNRYLLWHGSRLTNFVGILSHGLRIAPPEAPISGYMFGKGIYFADMVSKSANYCFTSKQQNTGLMLLCEVALGEMEEYNRSFSITSSLSRGKHSVKGIGRTYPFQNQYQILSDGVIVPKGLPITDLDIESELMYNEYIVYDVAQVKIKYLCKMNFKYK